MRALANVHSGIVIWVLHAVHADGRSQACIFGMCDPLTSNSDFTTAQALANDSSALKAHIQQRQAAQLLLAANIESRKRRVRLSYLLYSLSESCVFCLTSRENLTVYHSSDMSSDDPIH